VLATPQHKTAKPRQRIKLSFVFHGSFHRDANAPAQRDASAPSFEKLPATRLDPYEYNRASPERIRLRESTGRSGMGKSGALRRVLFRTERGCVGGQPQLSGRFLVLITHPPTCQDREPFTRV